MRIAIIGAGLADRNQAVPVHFAIDGDASGLRVGQFVDVEITERDEHDLIGDAIVETAGAPLDLKVL